ncbi:MAG: ATP phosphoribosyltransferase [Capnocytophaga sp.]|nr:ATP phosphoribosyltransferase [Capnocytophaga sp.]
MERIKIAVQKKGRLSEKSLELLGNCGIKVYNSDRKLKTSAGNFPMEVLFLRDDDIPKYVEQGVVDIGILGLNEVEEKNADVNIVKQLGFARCRMSLALPREVPYASAKDLEGKKIATSYPVILQKFLDEKGVKAEIEVIGGSVEIAPNIGLGDAIFDIVSTGSTLQMNGLKEVETLMKSEAVLIGNKQIKSSAKAILEKLLFRIDAVQEAANYKYILLNTSYDNLDNIIATLPGIKSPTVVPLAEEGWCSVHSVIEEDDFWEIIDKLKTAGAEGILVTKVEKMIR